MKNKNVATTRTTRAMEPIEIESVEQLQRIVDAPLPCVFAMDGKVYRVMCKRVPQDIDDQVRALQRAALPPYIESRKDHDNLNPQYLAARELNFRKARALLIYSGCPAVDKAKSGLTNVDQIHAYVKTLWTEHILEMIALTITAGGMELVERANFTSTSASES